MQEEPYISKESVFPVKHILTGWAIFFASLVTATGILVLLGWGFDIAAIKRPIPGLVAMNPLTALCFIITGISFLLLSSDKKLKHRYFTGYTLASLVIAMSVLRLISLFITEIPRIDQVLFSAGIQADATINLTSSMAANTALGFIFSGIALLLLNYETKRKMIPAQFFALLIFIFGFFSLLGYFYQVPEFYNLLKHLPMALHTAVCFILISIAVFFTDPHKGITKQFTGSSSGAFVGRIFIFTAIAVPIVLGGLRLYIHRYNFFSAELGTTLLVLSVIIVFSALLLYCVILLNREDILRKKDEKLIRNANKKFSTIFSLSPVAVAITSVPEGRFIMVNDAFCEITLFKREDILGKKPVDLNIIDPAVRNRQVRKQLIQDGRGKNIETKIIQADGKVIDVLYSAERIVLDNESCFAFALVDITERKRIVEKLRISEETFRSLVTSVKDYAIIMLDVNGNIMTWNEGAQAIKGYEKDEIKGKNMSVLYTKEERDKKLPEHILAVAKEKGRVENEGWRVKKNGSLFWANVIITSLYDMEGKLMGFGKVTRDMTEWKKARDLLTHFNEELTRQVQEKTRELEETTMQLRLFAAHLQTVREEERKYISREIHDELGQMTTGLRMDIIWLRNNSASTDDAIRNRFERTLDLLNEAKQVMRRIAADLHPAILEDLGLTAALERYSEEFEKRSGIITNFVHDDITEINMSTEMRIGLYRVFQESFTNVAKHANAMHIDAFLKTRDNKLVLGISDDGAGFDAEKNTGKGTIGLLSMRERALMMNGTCEIYSLMGEGTTILLTVPLN